MAEVHLFFGVISPPEVSYIKTETPCIIVHFSSNVDGDNHPVQTVAHLMKLSFDEGHRQAICQLGGIHSIANLVEVTNYHSSS